jgi:hypothetical protein
MNDQPPIPYRVLYGTLLLRVEEAVNMPRTREAIAGLKEVLERHAALCQEFARMEKEK